MHARSKYQKPQKSCLIRQQNPVSQFTVASMSGTTSPPTHASPSLAGLLRGDTLPNRDGHPGAACPADPSVVAASDLPPGLGAEGPGSHESQVSRGTRCTSPARPVLPHRAGGSPVMSAQTHGDGRPFAGVSEGAGSILVQVDAQQVCWPMELMGSLLSVCRMDNGEACFILSSRNEVDRTAAVSQAWGMAWVEISPVSGWKGPG